VSNFTFKSSNTPYKFFKISLFVFRIMCVALLYAWYRDLYPTLPPLTKGRNRLQAHRRSPLTRETRHLSVDPCPRHSFVSLLRKKRSMATRVLV
jgi:hypothetical protein